MTLDRTAMLCDLGIDRRWVTGVGPNFQNPDYRVSSAIFAISAMI